MFCTYVNCKQKTFYLYVLIPYFRVESQLALMFFPHVKVFIDILLVLYTLLFLLFCQMNIVLEFETYDKDFCEKFISFQ